MITYLSVNLFFVFLFLLHICVLILPFIICSVSFNMSFHVLHTKKNYYALLNLILSSAFILLNVLYLYLCSISSPCISFYFRHLIGFSATSSLTPRECSTSCTCVLALSVRTCLHFTFTFFMCAVCTDVSWGSQPSI